ncbi:MAG: accessory factor UbiK family protein [Burkholderiaceae bacterium]
MNDDQSSKQAEPGARADDPAGRRAGRDNRNYRSNPLSDLPEKLLELLRASPAAEVEHHVKAIVAQAADRMDLVPREEFEIQKAVVERLRERIEALEKQLNKQ